MIHQRRIGQSPLRRLSYGLLRRQPAMQVGKHDTPIVVYKVARNFPRQTTTENT